MLRQIIGCGGKLCCAIALSVSVAAHALNSSEQYYEDGRQRFAAGDAAGALIQLKNALQQDGQHVPSLVLLGEIYLQQGDSAAAEDALSDALLLGADKFYVAVKLAEAYLQQKNYLAILKDLPLDGMSGPRRVDMLGFHAEAYIGLGRLDDALVALDEADRLDPQAKLPALSRVTVYIHQGKLGLAQQVSERLLDIAPEDTRSWNAYASVFHARGQLEEALGHYSKAIALSPKNLDARVARAGLLIDLHRDQLALEELTWLANAFPYEPRAAYLRALVHARLGDRVMQQTALRQCADIVAVLPIETVAIDTQLTMSVALSHFGLGEFETARNYLDQYLRRNSQDLPASKLQASVLLQLNAANEAIKLLRPLTRQYPGDATLLSLLATAYSQVGQYASAISLLESLVGTGFGGDAMQQRLALTRLDAGERQQGTRELAAYFAKDPTRGSTGMALGLTYLRGHQYQQAIEVARTLVSREPANLSYLNMLGMGLYFAGEFDAATAVFSNMLELQPGFFAAELNLVRVALARGRNDTARQRLDRMLTREPGNASLMLEQARLERAEGDLPEARRWAENAARTDPRVLESRVFLCEIYLQLDDQREAEKLARNTVAELDQNLDAMAVLGQVLARVNKPKEAALVYNRMAKIAGFEPLALYRIAILQRELGAYQEAQHSLFKALNADPGYRDARIAFTAIHMVLGEPGTTLTLAEQGAAKYPRDGIWYQLQGEALQRLGKPAASAQAFQQVLQLGYDRPALLGWYRALLAQGKLEEGEQLLRKYLSQYADDRVLQIALAEHFLRIGDWQAGKLMLAELLEDSPGQPQLLNNLANAKFRLGEADALDYALQAHAGAPEDPMINDTLGWLLVQDQRAEEGLKYLREANTRVSNSPELRYHLAVALSNIGRRVEARKELKAALAGTGEYEWRQQAELLEKQLQ